jgi:NitT/TauT family transport system substrate-binding protein
MHGLVDDRRGWPARLTYGIACRNAVGVRSMKLGRRGVLGGLTAIAMADRARAATPIRLGLLHTLSPAPLYLAQQRGYFHDAGTDVAFVFFDAAQPIAAAAVAGDIDIGITALTGGFFALAGKGQLKVIGGGLHEQKGFEGTQLLVSKKAYESGLTTPAKLPGHSLAITQYGSSFHYMLGRIAQAEGFDVKSVTLRPVQQLTNMLAAVRTGQVDATMTVASQAKALEATGEAKIIANVGDIVPYQLTALFTTSKMIADNADAVRAFCKAYQRGVADYRAAFLGTDPQGKPLHDARTDAAVKDIQAYVFTGDPQAATKIEDGVGWYDEGAALDVADVANQIAWFEAQGLVKGPIDPKSIIDTSFLPQR